MTERLRPIKLHSQQCWGFLFQLTKPSQIQMEPDKPHFTSKTDVVRFVQAKALDDKKPFRVSRSDSRRFHVRCPDERCPFQMRFWARKDGAFRLIRDVAHTCTMFKLTTPAAFIQGFIRNSLEENPAVTTTELCKAISETTNVSGKETVCDVKKFKKRTVCSSERSLTQ